MSKKRSECLQSHALDVPWVQILKEKRVVLASASPRRKEILAIFVWLLILIPPPLSLP